MALKFLNKKGWHTGSLRNIENVWKAEQKHNAEEKKLEELRKQIQEERERSEFRLLQEQAGLVPKQERLDFLYDSGLAVGKGSSEGFKALEAVPKAEPDTAPSSLKQPSVPGALFEEKPQSANDTWRKLHSDPLLLIRQREKEALARIKNNPVQMANIRKSVETKKKHKESHEKMESKKHSQRNSKHDKHSSSKGHRLEDVDSDEERRKKRSHRDNKKHEQPSWNDRSDSEVEERRKRSHQNSKYEEHSTQKMEEPRAAKWERSRPKQRQTVPKLSEDEKAARLREMQQDAVLHEEQRWKRLKKASETDIREAKQDGSSGGRNFLDAAHKSVYGAEKGGSSTIEESVRRRSYYSQGRSDASEGNAFRR